MGVFFIALPADAAKPIARIANFHGEVIVLTDKGFKDVRIGLPLNAYDRVQTKEGEAEITFSDGAIMKVRPFSSTMIEEREEESGWWIFKTKKVVRRLTVFVGKLWFKSGSSKKENYLQTPTAVCGLRGSEAEWGSDLVTGYLNVITGSAFGEMGPWIKGLLTFDNTKTLADQSDAYKAMKAAYDGIKAGGLTEEAAKALITTAVKEVIKELAKNPDPNASQGLKDQIQDMVEDGELTEDAADAIEEVEIKALEETETGELEETTFAETENPIIQLYGEEGREETVSPSQ